MPNAHYELPVMSIMDAFSPITLHKDATTLGIVSSTAVHGYFAGSDLFLLWERNQV